MRKIFTIITLSLSFLSLNSLSLISQELNNNNVFEKTNEENKKNKLVLSTNSSSDKNVEILLSGIGLNPKLEKEITNNLITLNIQTSNLENINSLQSLSIPSVGIKTLIMSGYENNIKIVITPLDQINFSNPEFEIEDNILKMIFPKQTISNNTLNEKNIFSLNSVNNKKNKALSPQKASAPP